MPACPENRRWFQSCIVRPTTLWPWARSIAATVEESTPPDIATAMVEGIIVTQSGWAECQDLLADRCLIVNRRQLAQPGHRLNHESKSKLDVFRCVLLAKTEANTAASVVGAESHGGEHMRRLNRTGRARGAGRNCHAL